MGTLQQHAEVQGIAKRVLTELAPTLIASESEQTIATRAATFLAAHGVVETWYYNCPALVLLGSRSCLSISGRVYQPSDELVGQFNVVTIDLSPLLNLAWGDCARTFVIENGVCTPTPMHAEFQEGFDAELQLHQAMRTFVSPRTTFEELFAFGNAEIRRLGFENLDFQGNLGHSIVSRREDRLYIEPGNRERLSAIPFFTFEPHIRKVGSRWGFKHEDIYYFNDTQRLQEL